MKLNWQLWLCFGVGLLTSQQAWAQSFEATGMFQTTARWPTGKEYQSLKFAFRIQVERDAWSIRVDDLAVQAGTRQSYDFAECAYDERDFFCTRHFPAAARTNAQPRFPGEVAFDTFAMVEPAQFPTNALPMNADGTMRIIWLAFCSAHYPRLSSENFPPLSPVSCPTNVAALKIDYLESPPGLPKNLKVWAKGVEVFQKGAQQPTLLRPSVPFEDGYLSLEMQVRSVTNFGGMVLPREVAFSWYHLDVSVKPPRRYLSSEKTLVLNEIRSGSGRISLPPLPGVANVQEWRFRDEKGGPYHYVATNGKWASRSDPHAVDTLEFLPKVPIYRTPPAKPGGAP